MYLIIYINLHIKEGGHSSPVVACWTSDHWAAGSNPLRGMFLIINKFHLIVPHACFAQFSLNNVQKRVIKQTSFHLTSKRHLNDDLVHQKLELYIECYERTKNLQAMNIHEGKASSSMNIP